MSRVIVCKKCNLKYFEDYDDENEGTSLCCDCFESGVEQHEIDKRRRVAEQNEY